MREHYKDVADTNVGDLINTVEMTKRIVLQCTLPGLGASKKNQQRFARNKKTGQQYLIQNERYVEWLDIVKEQLRPWMAEQAEKHNLVFPLAQIRLRIIYYFPDMKVRDGPGKEQALFDMFTGIKMVLDDDWKNIDDCHWTARLDRKRPRTDLYITVVQQDQSEWMDHLVRKKSRSKRLKQVINDEVEDMIR
jgi:nucleoid DNA-binding protein